MFYFTTLFKVQWFDNQPKKSILINILQIAAIALSYFAFDIDCKIFVKEC